MDVQQDHAQSTGKLIALSEKSHALKGNDNLAHSVAKFIPLFTANQALSYHVRGHVNCKDVTFLLDTGAALTLLQSRVWERTGVELKHYTGPDLVGADGSPIPVRGSASVTIKLRSGNFDADVVIVAH